MQSQSQEIAKFDELAAYWWNPEGPLKTLHQINPLRLSYVERFTSLKDKYVLDVGCGAGIFSEALAQKKAQVTAIDLAPALIETAQAHAVAQGLKIHYHCIALENLDLIEKRKFEVITCLEMLEHVDKPLELITQLATRLEPQGLLFVSTINRTFKAYALAILGAEYLLNIVPKGTHDYSKFIKPSELTQTCEQAGLELIDLSGMHYQPFTAQANFTSDLNVNYLGCFRKK